MIWQGAAEPDTGIPGNVQGRALDRVLRAPCAGTVVPLVEIAEHADGVQQLAALDPAGFHWLVFTSANAARAYLGMHRAVPTNVAAVGTATADILRRDNTRPCPTCGGPVRPDEKECPYCRG